MSETPWSTIDVLNRLDPASPHFATWLVDELLAIARSRGASDIHLQPTSLGLDVRWRIDGVLDRVGLFPREAAPKVVGRLKVLADLLTYRTDVPQEGRIRQTDSPAGEERTAIHETRVSTFPTLHGEQAVIRLFAEAGRFQRLDELGLPGEVLERLRDLLAETSGAILVCGPAGSGKTTTLYACLREIVAHSSGSRNVTTLEDPIEVALDGVAQSQVDRHAELDLARGLRFLLRLDPEVIMVGEIRDPATADGVFQASLTGHLVLSTFHAGSAAAAISRLSDMGIEPYLLRSGIRAVVCQRLVRRLCACAQPSDDPFHKLGLEVASTRIPVGCDACRGTGYKGRGVLAEMLVPDHSDLARAILSRDDTDRLEHLARQAGMTCLRERAAAAVEQGWTGPAEIRRVLGFPGDRQDKSDQPA